MRPRRSENTCSYERVRTALDSPLSPLGSNLRPQFSKLSIVPDKFGRPRAQRGLLLVHFSTCSAESAMHQALQTWQPGTLLHGFLTGAERRGDHFLTRRSEIRGFGLWWGGGGQKTQMVGTPEAKAPCICCSMGNRGWTSAAGRDGHRCAREQQAWVQVSI